MNNQRKRVLITGATGSIGRQTMKFLAERTDQLDVTCFIHKGDPLSRRKEFRNLAKNMTCVYGDIADLGSIMIATHNQDQVIHLAGIIPPLADKVPEMAHRVNVQGTLNLVTALEKNSPDAFLLYSSSISVYGDRLKKPEINVGDPLKPSLGDEYGLQKLEAERIIQRSNLNWSIFRLAGIMDPQKNKPEAIMFHVPLKTSFEICTTRDCGRALVNALEHQPELENRIFNLGGGETCRGEFSEYLSRALAIGGMGELDFPEGAFATANFHCGYYMDGHELEDILKFRKDTKEDYFEMMSHAIPEWQKAAARLLSPVIKWTMLQTSDPWKAKRRNDPSGMKRYFNVDVEVPTLVSEEYYQRRPIPA
ncbi:MAG: NAD(P)-dependent oxidoreductase [Flavobacteriales bacterium]|jgi:nucleoside-diphosphate-sugar epimerase|nr:NAD(P)-dependent oxidoreductase [Flavobacteriales bacterium]